MRTRNLAWLMVVAMLGLTGWAPRSDAAELHAMIVEDANGFPVEGAQLEVWTTGSPETEEASAGTDAFGMAITRDLAPGPHRLRIVHPAFLPTELPIHLAADEVLRREFRLARVPGPPRFDVYTEVVCVTAGIPLENIPVHLDRFNAPGDPTPAETRTVRTDALGAATFRGMASGHVRFRVNGSGDGGNPGWFEFTSPSPLPLTQAHQAMIHLKPVPRTLEVRVEGFNPITRNVEPLSDVVVELTGLAPAPLTTNVQATVVPPRTGITMAGGIARFAHLPSIPWLVRTKRLGYAPREQRILPAQLNGVVPVGIDAELRTLSVQLTGPYTNPVVFAGVPLRLEGLTNSNTAGIVRETLQGTDGAPPHLRIFEDLLPGRYRLSLDGAPAPGGVIHAAPHFHGHDTVEVFSEGTTEVLLPVEVTRAQVRGRLLIAERSSASLPAGDPTSYLAARRPAYAPAAVNGIEFLEYLEDPLLHRTNRTFVADTDAAGHFTLALPPGRYGIRIPGLTNHWGSHVLTRTLSTVSTNPPPNPTGGQGWPYFETWRHSGRPPRNGTPNDGEALVLPSGEVALDLFVRRQVVHVGGTLVGPSVDVVLGHSDDEGLIRSHSFSAIAMGGAQATLTDRASGVGRTVPFVDDGANVTDLYLFPDTPPGDYELSFSHPWLTMPFSGANTFRFRVFEWRAPGVLPLLDPHLPENPGPMGFKPIALLSSASFPQGPAAPTFEVHRWNEEADPPAYELQPNAGVTVELVRPDYADGLVFRRLSRAPQGAYTFWARVSAGGDVYEGREGAAGTPGIHAIYIGGPRDNVGAIPPATSYTLLYRAISNEDPTLLIPGIQLGLGTDVYSPPEQTLTTSSTDATSAGLTSPLTLVSAHDPAGRWRPLLKYQTNRIGSVVISVETNIVHDLTLLDPAARRLVLTVRMQADTTFTGSVTGPSSHAQTTAQVYDRVGNPVGPAPVGPAGEIDLANALAALSNVTQTLYVDITAPGFRPVRQRLRPDPAAATSHVSLTLDPVPPPTIVSATSDRFGLFIPGVKRTGNPASFLTATAPLTLTWRVRVQPTGIALPMEGFDEAPPGTPTTEPDPIDEVLLINPARSTGDWFGTEPVPIDIPNATDPLAVRRWVDEIRQGAHGRVFVSRATDLRSTDTDGITEAEGVIRLWSLPPGEFQPVVVVLTKYGAVALQRGFNLPSDSHRLKGVPTPRWLGTAIDIFGITAGIQPTAEKLAGYFTGERFRPLPRFEARIEPNPTPGFVTYLYNLAVQWREGQDSQEEGYLNFAPDPLGLEIDADFELGFNARQLNEYYGEVTANGVLTGLDLSKNLPKAARNWVTDGPTGQLEVVGRTLNQRNLDDRGAPWEMQFDDEFQGNLQVEAEINLIPFTGRIPNIGPLLKVLDQTELAQSFLDLRGGVGINVRRVWESLYPPNDNEATGNPQVFRRNVFGGDERHTTTSNHVALCFNFGAKLRLAALGGHLGASAELAIEGTDPGCLIPSMVVIPNLSAEWPPIRSVHGQVNAHFEAFFDAWITRFEKRWTWNLLTFTNSFGTDPFLSFRPVTIATQRITPATTPPATFHPVPTPTSTNLIDGLFPAGSFEASSSQTNPARGPAASPGLAGQPPASGGDALVFTDTDPAQGLMAIRFTRRLPTGPWSTPVTLATAPGIIHATLAAQPSGGWMAAWSEIDATHLGNPFPPTRIRFATSATGDSWSPPALVADFPDAVAELTLTPSANQMGLVLRHTADGPQAVLQSIASTLWDGSGWSPVTPVATAAPVAAFRVAADPAGGWLVAVVERGGAGGSHAWKNGTIAPRVPFQGRIGRPFDLLATGPGTFLIASGTEDGLALDRLEPATGWRRIGVPIPRAAASDIALTTLPGNEQTPTLLAWVQGGSATTLRYATLNPDGTLAHGPQVAAKADAGAHSRLHLLPVDARFVRILARIDGDAVSVREFPVHLDPTANDLVTLSRPRLLPGGELEVFLDGNSERTYRLQTSADLVAWQDVGDPVRPNPAAPIRIQLPGTPTRAFVRARSD